MAGRENDENSQRQVRNLRGLLNFCSEVTAQEDTTQDSLSVELSGERRDFLEKVLEDMQGDVPKIIAQCLQMLTEDVVDYEDGDVSQQEDALDHLSEYVEDINYAIDLKKLNGFPILLKVLKSPHSTLVQGAAQVIGYVCQNNDVCQSDMLPLGAMQILLDVIDTHPDPGCKVKALFALSCLTRDFEPAEKKFEELSGFCFLMRAIQTQIPKLVNKSVFLLNYFIGKTDRIKETLLAMGFVEQLVYVLFSNELDDMCREFCTLSLLNLSSSSDKALQECLRPEFKLVSQLQDRRSVIAGKEEYEDEENHINSLIKILEEEGNKEDSMLR